MDLLFFYIVLFHYKVVVITKITGKWQRSHRQVIGESKTATYDSRKVRRAKLQTSHRPIWFTESEKKLQPCSIYAIVFWGTILQKNVCSEDEALLKLFMKVVETSKINGFALISNKINETYQNKG